MTSMSSPHPLAEEPYATLEEKGQAVLALLGRHFDGLRKGDAPITTVAQPGDFAKQIPAAPPALGRPLADILQDVEATIIPALTHWQHPRFMAYYPSTSSVPAILAETLIAAMGVVGLQWASSPACTELEVCVMDWLAGMIGVGGDFLHSSGVGGGIIQNTAGEAITSIMVCARINKQRQLLFPELPEEDLTEEQREDTYCADSSKLVAYMSCQTHFSAPKAVRVAGMRLRKIPARLGEDGSYGLAADDLRAQIVSDLAAGLQPCVVQLNYGTTNTSSNDPIEDVAQVAKEFGLWLHVDAAYAGVSWILPRFQARTKALEAAADSFNFNGSKWFLCGFDSAFLWVRSRRALQYAFAAGGDYLAPDRKECLAAPEFKDWALPLGRRFRSLRIWMVLNYYGVEGMQAHLLQGIGQADYLRGQLATRPDLFTLPIATELGLVVFALAVGGEGATERVAAKLQPEFMLYPSKLLGKPVIRAALGGVLTRQTDLDRLWEKLVGLAGQEGGGQQ